MNYPDIVGTGEIIRGKFQNARADGIRKREIHTHVGNQLAILGAYPNITPSEQHFLQVLNEIERDSEPSGDGFARRVVKGVKGAFSTEPHPGARHALRADHGFKEVMLAGPGDAWRKIDAIYQHQVGNSFDNQAHNCASQMAV